MYILYFVDTTQFRSLSATACDCCINVNAALMRQCLIYVKVGEYVHPRNSTVQDLLGCGPVGCWCLNGRRKWMMFCISASTGRKTYPFVIFCI